MSSIILTSLIYIVFGLGMAIILRMVFKSPPETNNATSRVSFRWHHTVLPLAIFLLSIAITGWFYLRLPEELAYNFKLNPAPDQFFHRGLAPWLMFLSQLIIILPIIGITWGITKMDTASDRSGKPAVMLERTLLIIGNMAALPQIIICFALTDIFSYNANGAHLMPLWLFSATILVTGSVFLGILFWRALRAR